ncbi:MAG: hypothetical protein NTU53_11700 [Planctomycetota bacterium]|nr:hypothetical protein [Planctomycetota bacterium]
MTFRFEQGNAVALNEALNRGSMTEVGAAAYRTPNSRNNTRIGGPFRATGLFGKGNLIQGLVWSRYYAVDRKAGPLGGVGVPRAHLELPTGERFWLQAKGQSVWARRVNPPVAASPSASAEPNALQNSTRGWGRGQGILMGIMEGGAQALAQNWKDARWLEMALRLRIRDADLRLENRGATAPPPGNLAASHTCCNYTTYLGRIATCGEGRVLALTGKLPRFPRTREGEPVMTRSEVRYFSIVRYQMFAGSFFDMKDIVTLYGGLMDDEILVPAEGANKDWYIIAYSRKKDRPANATAANGVTWQDWGPRSEQVLQVRWINVMPDWYGPDFSPDPNNIPLHKLAWSDPRFDPSLIGQNTRDGFMKDHHILIHYMTRQQFEALGPKPDPRKIPHWNDR